jgi:hypothetical protein
MLMYIDIPSSRVPSSPGTPYQGRIQDFKLGGAHLKKLRRKKYDFLA